MSGVSATLPAPHRRHSRGIASALGLSLALLSGAARADIPVPRPPCFVLGEGDVCDVEGERGVCRFVRPDQARLHVCALPRLEREGGSEKCLACILPPDPTLYGTEGAGEDPEPRGAPLAPPRRAWRDYISIVIGVSLALLVLVFFGSRSRRRV